MKRVLIVNADDCNLTPGVTHAILDCHDRGILSSTTFMANLPIEKETVRQILKRKNLGVGIHLNITFGKPVSKPSVVKSLIDSNGLFHRHSRMLLGGNPRAHGPAFRQAKSFGDDMAREYQAQIERFTKHFGKKPTHLDTHHQVHDHPFFLKVLLEVAKKNHLPIRKSRALRGMPVTTTDFFFGNLSPAGYWTREPLETILRNLPSGVSEIMCHPGRHDRALEAVSSFREGRQIEWKLFRDSALREILESSQTVLAHFGCGILRSSNSIQ